jgi:hypothetical protein
MLVPQLRRRVLLSKGDPVSVKTPSLPGRGSFSSGRLRDGFFCLRVPTRPAPQRDILISSPAVPFLAISVRCFLIRGSGPSLVRLGAISSIGIPSPLAPSGRRSSDRHGYCIVYPGRGHQKSPARPGARLPPGRGGQVGPLPSAITCQTRDGRKLAWEFREAIPEGSMSDRGRKQPPSAVGHSRLYWIDLFQRRKIRRRRNNSFARTADRVRFVIGDHPQRMKDFCFIAAQIPDLRCIAVSLDHPYHRCLGSSIHNITAERFVGLRECHSLFG